MATPIDISEEAGVRYLHFGSEWIQGAMRIARPWNLELEYTREMMAALLLREGGGRAAGHPPVYPSRVLREGGGRAAGHPPAASIPPGLGLDADCLPLAYPPRVLREGGGKAAGYTPAASIPPGLGLDADCLPLAYPSRVLRDDTHWPHKVLLIGLGAASLTKFLYRHYPLAHLTVVEIEPDVVAAARQFFKLPEDSRRINLVIGDGVAYLANSNRKFDLILVDGFDQDASSGELDTQLFYQSSRAHLSDQGILSVNLLTSNGRLDHSLSRIARAFDDRVLAFPSCESGNAIALAAAGSPIHISLNDMKEGAASLKISTGLNLMPTLTRLVQARTCLNNCLIM